MLKSQFRIIRNRFQFVISSCQMKLEFLEPESTEGYIENVPNVLGAKIY